MENQEPINKDQLSTQDILGLLPHRYPFALVDKVIDYIPGEKAIAIKNITINEPQFQGHFPGRPLMPGVLIVESMAQVGGLIVAKMPELPKGLFVFAGINNVKFRKPVFPGDQLLISCELVSLKRKRFGKIKGEAWEGPLEEIKKLGVRVVKCRAGIVLGRGNVATQIFTLISKLNLSGPIGKGDQYFSWVSIQDLVSAYIFCLENSNINGPVNCTAPEPLQQKEFSRIIAKMMNKKFIAPPLPPVIMQLTVGWELGQQLGLNSIRAIPKKLLKEGFKFQNTKLETMKAEFTNE